MHISNANINISKMVTYRVNIIIAIKYELHKGFRLAYLDFTLANSKDQGQGEGRGHSQFDCKCL